MRREKDFHTPSVSDSSRTTGGGLSSGGSGGSWPETGSEKYCPKKKETFKMP
jgi:hypothetical protein